MELVTAKIIAMVLMGVFGLFFGLLPLKIRLLILKADENSHKRKRRERIISALLCFGSGVLIATVFIHMLPETREGFEQLQKSKNSGSLQSIALKAHNHEHHDHHHNDSHENEFMNYTDEHDHHNHGHENKFMNYTDEHDHHNHDTDHDHDHHNRDAAHNHDAAHDHERDYKHDDDNHNSIDHGHDGNRSEQNQNQTLLHQDDEHHSQNYSHDHIHPGIDDHPNDQDIHFNDHDHVSHEHDSIHPHDHDHESKNETEFSKHYTNITNSSINGTSSYDNKTSQVNKTDERYLQTNQSSDGNHEETHVDSHNHNTEHPSHENDTHREIESSNQLSNGTRSSLVKDNGTALDLHGHTTTNKPGSVSDEHSEFHDHNHNHENDHNHEAHDHHEHDHHDAHDHHEDEHNHHHDTHDRNEHEDNHHPESQDHHDHAHENNNNLDPKLIGKDIKNIATEINKDNNMSKVEAEAQHPINNHFPSAINEADNVIHPKHYRAEVLSHLHREKPEYEALQQPHNYSNETEEGHDHGHERHAHGHEHEDEHGYPLAELVICLGFFLIYLIEEIVHKTLLNHSHDDDDPNNRLIRTASGRHAGGHGHSHFPNSHSQERRRSAKTKSTMNGHVMTNGNVHEPQSKIFPQESNGRLQGIDNPVFAGDIEATSWNPGLRNSIIAEMNNQISPATLSQPNAVVNNGTSLNVPSSGSSPKSKKSQGKASPSGVCGHILAHSRSFLVVVAVSFHSIFEGMAAGLQGVQKDVWFLFLAISAHQFVIIFCIGLELLIDGAPLALYLLYMITLALITPIGMGVGIIITQGNSIGGIDQNYVVTVLQGIAGGTLLYVALLEVLERERTKPGYRLMKFFCLILGFALMAALAAAGGHSHGHEPVEEAH